MNLDPDPDIVEVILLACQASGLDADAAHLIEARIRADYGGLRVRIPKRKKHMSDTERERAYQDSLSNMSDAEVCSKHGISRATLYRMVKKGPAK
jgi:transcriptional regulator of acetoin/glycerol metabolism